ncbi:unnamed protein product [Zymoseptoria tritici ST99CH_3D7]|uniref:Uncharacterized protein n=1 Tax=Zymoseptoria tritici (strain ST99CH_3D7) TaxID=1276538 RepID=A0A1X7SA72_ZYMT9|nr:unnamed protein product [Zymoseptoria tritici ST99CH_3D7]
MSLLIYLSYAAGVRDWVHTNKQEPTYGFFQLAEELGGAELLVRLQDNSAVLRTLRWRSLGQTRAAYERFRSAFDKEFELHFALCAAWCG